MPEAQSKQISVQTKLSTDSHTCCLPANTRHGTEGRDLGDH